MTTKLSVYLDNCCFNRPYDDQEFLSIHLETQAKISIQTLIENKSIILIWSSILDYENKANPDDIISDEISTWREKASIIIYQSHEVIERAIDINKSGISKKDSLHISSAVEAEADYFITTDKGIIKKSKSIEVIKIVNPVEFISILEGTDEI